MDIQELIKSKYPKAEMPNYVSGEDWVYNGFDLKTDEYDFLKVRHNKGLRFGQFFLYEHIEEMNDRETGRYRYYVLHYPRIAIYLNDRVIDMAVEVDFFNFRRRWESRREYEFTYKDENGEVKTYRDFPSERETEIERVIIWSDSLQVYGHWDALPGWKELRRAYEKTIWFHRSKEDQREYLLGSLLR